MEVNPEEETSEQEQEKLSRSHKSGGRKSKNGKAKTLDKCSKIEPLLRFYEAADVDAVRDRYEDLAGWVKPGRLLEAQSLKDVGLVTGSFFFLC